MDNSADQTRRAMLQWLAGATGAVTLLDAHANDFPTRQLKIINPTAPGGTVDTVARIMAEKMAPRLGQMVIVEHRPGGSGAIGAALVSKGPRDGYQIFFGTSSTIGYMKMLNKDLPYDPVKDLSPVAMVGSVPVGIFTTNAHPNLESFIAAAKARPGEFSYGSTGAQSLAHLAGELLCQRAGIDMVHVPYTGGAARYWGDLIGGRLQAVFAGITGGLPLVKDGQMKLVAIASRVRSRLLPDVPAAGEVFDGYDVPAWFGFAVANGTPAAVVRTLETAALAALREPSTRGQFAAAGVDLDPILGTKAFADKIATDNLMWERTFRTAGMLDK